MAGTNLHDRTAESGSRLTVVIPVWDRYVPLLENLFERLRNEFPAARFVVVDNASSVTLPSLDSATVVRLAVRRSTGAARNAALSTLDTPFVCFFDADDLPVPGTLQRFLGLADTRPEIVAVAGTGIAWHPAAREQFAITFSPRILALQRHQRLFGLASVVRNRYATVGSILRTDAVRGAGGFSDLNYCEDWSLATALAFRGRVHLVQEGAFLARIHTGSMIHQGGTPAGIVRALYPLYRRWLLDPAIPIWLKPLFLLTPIPRLRQAYDRWRTKTRSHDDLFERLGQHTLDDSSQYGAPETIEGSSGRRTDDA
jgi:glycosyltransferase involved in cell wall biosynthesis